MCIVIANHCHNYYNPIPNYVLYFTLLFNVNPILVFWYFLFSNLYILALVDCDGLVSLIKRRMQFPKAVVRKAAILALESVVIYNGCSGMSQVRGVLFNRYAGEVGPSRGVSHSQM